MENKEMINMYDLNHNYIRSYNNKKEILDEIGIKTPKFLNKNLNYHNESYKNHIYRYDYKDNIKNPNLIIKPNIIIKSKIKSNPLTKYDKYNQNNDELCHAFGCRKHKRLIKAFKGLFCEKHYNELLYIRNELNNAKLTNNENKEIKYRQKEFELRKFLDKGHMHFMYKLETKI